MWVRCNSLVSDDIIKGQRSETLSKRLKPAELITELNTSCYSATIQTLHVHVTAGWMVTGAFDASGDWQVEMGGWGQVCLKQVVTGMSGC